MPAEELKACPFCGSTSVNYHQSHAKSKTSIFYYHFYKCDNCGASSKGSDQFSALEKWNRRVGAAPICPSCKSTDTGYRCVACGTEFGADDDK